MYFISVITLFLFTLALNLIYSAFNNRNLFDIANIKVSGLSYNMTIDGKLENIINVSKNNTTKSSIIITSLNNLETQYELIYDVCLDSTCNNFIEKPDGLIIKYSSISTDAVNGYIDSNGDKSIRLVIKNETDTNYYIKLNINAEYTNNSLALKKQIIDEHPEENITIAAIINGEVSTTFPTNKNYGATIECSTNGRTSNATGNATWNGTKWIVGITGVESGTTVCNIYFETLAPNGWFTSVNGMLLKAIKDNNLVTNTITIPGRAISTSEEAVLASAADDYGTSYYYRGAVENNYVKFINMCWRIVRIVGDGSIKLALSNYNPNSVSNPCDLSQDGTSNAFARYDANTYTTAYNSTSNRNAYIGFMYGTPGSATYALEHANTNKSTILTNLETWYNQDNKFVLYESMLADNIWCNDKSLASGNGYGTEDTYYGARSRLYSLASANPTLVCPNDTLGGKLSKFTVSDTVNGNGKLTKKIGLLTADELAYAGGIIGTTNSTYYLSKNATEINWWSLSPYTFNGANSIMINVYPPGYLNNNGGVANIWALRPAVSLISSTNITGGDGTSGNPYIIQTT